MELEHQLNDLRAGRGVEVAGRLVGEQDRGLDDEGAGKRNALLLAARHLGGIVRPSVPSPTRASSASARSKASSRPASSSGTATFSSAVMFWIRWNDWKTMPTLRPRKRARASSSSAVRSSPATTILPESGRSSPAITISSVDLPDPDGPTIPTVSPEPILTLSPRRTWTFAAPEPRSQVNIFDQDGVMRHEQRLQDRTFQAGRTSEIWRGAFRDQSRFLRCGGNDCVSPAMARWRVGGDGRGSSRSATASRPATSCLQQRPFR